MKPELILLGTVHGDPWGYWRAWKWLTHLCPHQVTVEISPFSVHYRERQEDRWQKLLARALQALPHAARNHLAIRRVSAQVAMPFEYRVARDWSLGNCVPITPIDLSAAARHHLPRYARELLTSANLRALLATPNGDLGDWVRQEYKRARHLREGRVKRFPIGRPPEAWHREQVMAGRLQRLAQSGRRVVHLGGWEHVIPWADGTGLVQRLEDLKPQCLLLDDADRLA